MSILGTRTTTPNPTITSNNNNTTNMGTPFFHEFKKQASFFLREKIKMARLALTDCTPAQLLTEDATNENQWAPDTRTMGLISRAAFEVDDYWRIVDILHKRLSRFDRKNWRVSYKALILLEHLLTHGPESVAEEFQTDKDVIQEMESFQYIDERGFNWGLTVRKKSERVLKLLEKSQLLKEERDRARKLTRGIEGFGSFSHRSSSTEATSFRNSSMKMYERNHSESNDLEDNNQFSLDCSDEGQKNEMIKKQIDKSLKENKAPMEEITPELHEWDCKRESISLLDNQKDEVNVGFSIEEDHPFINSELQFTTSLTTT
ncbi:clathrin interactor 1-like isoform X2 [Telopea speciosissima]|uniref:clathrin interactor 1-like isoform X2 n=1 Tax=Telopea speciosissima TaxID=54955 RepID=UPI001CC5EBA6|nr:clathrin interactor 1-like isoform X2 [Telopea speciosissima]